LGGGGGRGGRVAGLGYFYAPVVLSHGL
jgi:hypothetical protein